jgi:hypothetical protein
MIVRAGQTTKKAHQTEMMPSILMQCLQLRNLQRKTRSWQQLVSLQELGKKLPLWVNTTTCIECEAPWALGLVAGVVACRRHRRATHA